ncbi:MAG: hypothetical protein GF383_02825 [Candidatus Lokiarchaeota archaeon]|nr:hypothetical protein [Candidatus Lokiarchaeota archaeon]
MYEQSMGTSETNVEINPRHILKKVKIVCPICKKSEEIPIPDSIVANSQKIITLSVPEGIVCDHHFQAFIDQQCKVRGYQKVDYILSNRTESSLNEKKSNHPKRKNRNLFDQLILKENYVEYDPRKDVEKNKIKADINEMEKQFDSQDKKKITQAEIYEEFWEFIDNNNQEFQEFIKNDDRRSNSKRTRL